MRIGLVATVAGLLALAILAGEVQAAEPSYRGRRLVDVLQELQDEGLDLIFSSAVVGDDVRVPLEPSAKEPRAVLEEILVAVGLEARDGPAGSILVVEPRAAAPSPATLERPLALRSTLVTEIVVTPGRHSVVREPQAAGRSVVGEDALLVPTIGGDISRVVELLPGVTAADNSAAFHVRGSGARDVSLVLDGLELYDPFHFQGFQSPFSLIDREVVERIDFFAGGFTADRGDRHGGFVDVSTLLPEERGRSAVEVGTLKSRISYSTPFAGGSGAWLLSLRGWYPEALRDAIELGGGERVDPRFGDFYAKAAFAVSPRTRVSGHMLFSYDRLSFTEKNADPGEDPESANALTRNGYLWFRALNAWSNGVTFDTMVSGGRIERFEEGLSRPQDDSSDVAGERVVDFFGIKHDATWQVATAHLFKAGAEIRRLDARYRYQSVPRDPLGTPVSVVTDPSGTSFAAYAAHRARITPNLATELGLRWDRQTYVDAKQLSPRFNAFWRIAERSELRLGLGRFSQSQRIHELQVEDGETDFSGAEISEQAELTFQHRSRGGLVVRVDAYYRKLSRLRPRYENLFEPVELFPETGDDRVLVAPRRARLRGVEILLRGDPTRPLAWWISYAASSAEDVIENEHVPRNWDQTHAAKFLLGYRWAERWSVSLAGTMHTGWPTTPMEGEVVTLPGGGTEIEPVLGLRNSDRFGAYARLDAKAVRSFALERGRLALTVEIVNLLDRRNVCCVDGFDFEERPDGSVAVRREFDYWLGITPSFNALWEF